MVLDLAHPHSVLSKPPFAYLSADAVHYHEPTDACNCLFSPHPSCSLEPMSPPSPSTVSFSVTSLLSWCHQTIIFRPLSLLPSATICLFTFCPSSSFLTVTAMMAVVSIFTLKSMSHPWDCSLSVYPYPACPFTSAFLTVNLFTWHLAFATFMHLLLLRLTDPLQMILKIDSCLEVGTTSSSLLQ